MQNCISITVKDLIIFLLKGGYELVNLKDNSPINITIGSVGPMAKFGKEVEFKESPMLSDTKPLSISTAENLTFFIHCVNGTVHCEGLNEEEMNWGIVMWAKDIPDVRDGTMIRVRMIGDGTIRYVLNK